MIDRLSTITGTVYRPDGEAEFTVQLAAPWSPAGRAACEGMANASVSTDEEGAAAMRQLALAVLRRIWDDGIDGTNAPELDEEARTRLVDDAGPWFAFSIARIMRARLEAERVFQRQQDGAPLVPLNGQVH